jgi:putative DNA primase/helicase
MGQELTVHLPEPQPGNAKPSRISHTPRSDSTNLRLSRLEPWPEQVDGAALLDELTAVFGRFLALPEGTAEAMALWVMFTHAFDAAEVSPRLALLSPVPACGKTTTLSILNSLVPKPMFASNVTPAVVFRVIERDKPTLLIDEADTYMERHDEFRGILNSGHTRAGAAVWRSTGENFEPKRFSTWAPMAIAKIGKLADTLASRSIIVQMRRKRPDEHVERFRPSHDTQLLKELARKAARWAQDNLETLKGADPEMATQLSDRALDNWRPLLAIADAVGGDWSGRARSLALMLSGSAEPTDEEQMLVDIHEVFTKRGSDRISSKDLSQELRSIEGGRWGSLDSGLSQGALANKLRPFGIRPHSVRISPTQTPKGYMLEDFEDAFARYLPEKRNTATSEENQGIEPPLARNKAA